MKMGVIFHTAITPGQMEALLKLEAIFRKRDVTAAGRYAAMACEPAPLHFQGSSSSILVLG
jgi:hypothetical protein